jgi:hypothetical protein
MNQECLKQASIILQDDQYMLQECFNMSQVLSSDEGLVLLLVVILFIILFCVPDKPGPSVLTTFSDMATRI